MIPYDVAYGNMRNYTFADMYPTIDAFMNGQLDTSGEYISIGYKTAAIPQKISDESATTLYYLLYGQYGNSTIVGIDNNQWCYKLWSIVYMYGGTWEKRIAIQDEVRALTIDDAVKGGTSINNQSLNPSEAPVNDSEDILKTINTQVVNRFNKSKVEGYQYLMDLLETDVTKAFLDKFKVLFLKIVAPEEPLYYETELIEGEDING